MGKLLCEKNVRDVWCRNESVRAEIGQILHTHTHTHTHTHAAKLVVEMYVEERVSIWIRSVCDPTFSSWACGDAVSPQWGRAESRWQTHIGNNLKLAENQVSDVTCW